MRYRFAIVGLLVGVAQTATSADYVADPLSGSMSNAGNAEHPWGSLEAVFAAGKTFAAGDRILLRRGNHGNPVVKGHNSGTVTIQPDEGHTPVLGSLRFEGAKNWTVQDLFINPEVVHHKIEKAMIQLEKSTAVTVNNCGAHSTGNPWGWGASEDGWLKGQHQGLLIESNCTNNTIHGCHFMNTGNGMASEGAANTVEYCVLENFTRDGVVPIGARCIWQYNLIMNAIVADYDHNKRVHRDSWQAWVRHPGVIIRGNTTIAATDLKQPLVFPHSPGLAGWDGPFEGWIIENNVFCTDLRAGIELNNATNCRIVHNTCLPVSGGAPEIRISPKGGKSSGNVIFNNISAKYMLIPNEDGSPPGESGNNLIFKSTMFCGYNPARGKFDLHLTAPLPGNPKYGCEKDHDGNVRPKSKGDTPDIGAYEYGYFIGPDMSPPTTPSQLRVIIIPDVGADLQWIASKDDRAVAGYDIYRNGTRIGRSRNGPHYFDVYPGKTKVTYSVIAFDRSGNYSGMSAAGTVKPLP